MGLIRTISVQCDRLDCLEWTHGDIGRRPNATTARTNARRAGWACGPSGDFCPDHHPILGNGLRCPHGCGKLNDGGGGGQFICPRCGDEWDADTLRGQDRA